MRKYGTITLAFGVATLALLLDTGTAQAVPMVVLDGNDNVIQILGLPVVRQSGVERIYDVDFTVGTWVDVYGNPPDIHLRDENAPLGLAEVLGTLNDWPTLAQGAGPEGSDQFFIAAFLEEPALISAVGGEFYPSVPDWDRCDNNQAAGQADCLLGITVFLTDVVVTWAEFTVPEPGTALLMGLGFLGLGVVGKSRREESDLTD
jgi:hypothetical protein